MGFESLNALSFKKMVVFRVQVIPPESLKGFIRKRSRGNLRVGVVLPLPA